MKIFLVCPLSKWHLNSVKIGKGRKILISYFVLREKDELLGIKEKWGVEEIFLDSGAFSAWTQHEPIDIDEYIKFIYEVKDYVDVYVSLDDCRLNKKISARNSKKNYLIMRKAGLNPMPVWHLGEDTKLLRFYNEQTDYVGVGGVASAKLNRAHLGEIVKRNVVKGTKVHLFGIMKKNILLDYPYYSTDATSWIKYSAFGGILLFEKGDIKVYKVRDLNAMSKSFGRFQKLSGFTMEEVAGCSYKRATIAVLSLQLYEKFLTEVWKRRGLEWKK